MVTVFLHRVKLWALAVSLSWAVVIGGLQGASVTAAEAGDDIFQELAKDIVWGLDQTTPEGLPNLGRKPRIAIWPFDENCVSSPLVGEFNDAFLDALFKQVSGKYALVARKELSTVIKDMTDSAQGTIDPVDVVLGSSSVDILITGSVGLHGDDVTLTYKAIGVSGKAMNMLLAVSSRPIEMEVGQAELLSLDQAICEAARRFADHAGDMVELRLAGFRFQDSGVQTEFGRYVESKLSNEISMLFLNFLTGRKLVVLPAEISNEKLQKMRGSEARKSDLLPENFVDGLGVYTLTGNYYDREQTVELTLVLRDSKNATIPWSGQIKRPKLLEIRPPGNFPPALLSGDDRGAIQFTLSSARGKDPVYRIGDKLYVLIQMDRDAWVYCYYRQSNNQWITMFPNQHHEEAFLKGNQLHTIPDDNYSFDFDVSEPAGIDLVKCFAVDRDVTAELPQIYRPQEIAQLPPGSDFKLLQAFSGLRNAEVTSTSLIITIESQAP